MLLCSFSTNFHEVGQSHLYYIDMIHYNNYVTMLTRKVIIAIILLSNCVRRVLSFFGRALSEADVIFLFGARLNWILHFGKPPRFKADVKIIQV